MYKFKSVNEIKYKLEAIRKEVNALNKYYYSLTLDKMFLSTYLQQLQDVVQQNLADLERRLGVLAQNNEELLIARDQLRQYGKTNVSRSVMLNELDYTIRGIRSYIDSQLTADDLERARFQTRASREVAEQFR